jgi:hypothetical protein
VAQAPALGRTLGLRAAIEDLDPVAYPDLGKTWAKQSSMSRSSLLRE